jgi:hypothetical protein
MSRRTAADLERFDAVEGEILNHLLVHARPVGLCIALREDFHLVAENQVTRELLHLHDDTMRLPDRLCETRAAQGIEASREGGPSGIRQRLFSLDKPDAAAPSRRSRRVCPRSRAAARRRLDHARRHSPFARCRETAALGAQDGGRTLGARPIDAVRLMNCARCCAKREAGATMSTPSLPLSEAA